MNKKRAQLFDSALNAHHSKCNQNSQNETNDENRKSEAKERWKIQHLMINLTFNELKLG